MGGVIGFGDSLVVSSDAKKIVLSGFTEIVSSPVLVIDYTGTAA